MITVFGARRDRMPRWQRYPVLAALEHATDAGWQCTELLCLKRTRLRVASGGCWHYCSSMSLGDWADSPPGEHVALAAMATGKRLVHLRENRGVLVPGGPGRSCPPPSTDICLRACLL